MKNTADTRFYVYVYLDPRKPGKYIYEEYSFDYEPFYIGKGCDDRSTDHLFPSSLKSKSYKNHKIKKIIKETKNNPKIDIIKNNLFEKEALSLEIKLVAIIGRNDLHKGPLTNLTDAGEGVINVSKETVEFIANKNRKTILQYSIDGIFIQEYHGIKKTAKLFGLQNGSSISGCLYGKFHTAIGYVWRFKENDNFQLVIEPVKQENRAIKHPVLQYSMNGNFIKKWNSITEVAMFLTPIYSIRDAYKSKVTPISNVCRGETQHAFGFIWFYYNDNDEINEKINVNIQQRKRPVVQFDLHLNELKTFNSIVEASKEIKISNACILECCQGTQKTAKGFIWRFLEEKDKLSDFKIEELNNRCFGRVIQKNKQGKFIKEYENVTSASKITSINRDCISNACRKKQKTAGGFIWECVGLNI